MDFQEAVQSAVGAAIVDEHHLEPYRRIAVVHLAHAVQK
jgi:hypothetical protein